MRISWPRLVLALVPGIFLLLPLQASQDRVKDLLQEAQRWEGQGEWEKACDLYETVIRFHRNSSQIKERYQHCLRRIWQVRRHQDPSYRKEVLSLDYGQAIHLYKVVLDTLLEYSLEKGQTDPNQLFHKGLEELDHALASSAFRQMHLHSARESDIQAFRAQVKKTWGGLTNRSRQQVVKHVREVSLAAAKSLKLHTTVAVMELTCGACYALDNYSVYLTPGQLQQLCKSLHGEIGSVGLTLGIQDGKLAVVSVAPGTPAAETAPPLSRDDHVLSIDKKPATMLTLEAAQEMLVGLADTMVELEVQSPDLGRRTVILRRRPMFVRSVAYEMYSLKNDDGFIGYVRIGAFQDSTLQELDDALMSLTRSGMKALVLDLRGNGGGLFETAIEAARRFISAGIIVSTQTFELQTRTIYQSNNAAALTVPMVVLIDGDTASAAEVLAGALKDHKRARLVGQTTFGKGCIQTLLKLPASANGTATGGLRVTVARFFSPSGQPFADRGVSPHLFVERYLMSESAMSEMDPQFQEALDEAQRLVEMTR